MCKCTPCRWNPVGSFLIRSSRSAEGGYVRAGVCEQCRGSQTSAKGAPTHDMCGMTRIALWVRLERSQRFHVCDAL